MPKIDLDDPDLPRRSGTRYPGAYGDPCRARSWIQLGQAGGLTDFGANLVTVPPGSWSSQRHAHEIDDEFLMMIEGELVLIEDAGRTPLRAGDFAAFPMGTNGHHLVNESAVDARFLVIGANKGGATYPDIDLLFAAGVEGYLHTDGTPY
jgi:uncharacterized cupin superfamily protein